MFVEGEVKVFNLMCRVVEERHLASNIQKWLKEGQQEFGINNNQLLTFTIDSAANMTKAVDDFIGVLDEEEVQEIEKDFAEESDLMLHEKIDENEDIDVNNDADDELEESSFVNLPATRIHCAVHRLQLGVNDLLRKGPYNRAVAIAQKLTAKLRTPTARLILKRENLKAPKMFQETRWSSTLNMLDRLLELKVFCEENQNLWKGN